MPWDVLLIQPPIEDFYITKKRTTPYGLAAIAAALEIKGFQTQIFDSLATPKSRVLALPEEFAHIEPFYERPDLSLFSLFHEFRHFGYSFEHLGNQVRRKKPFLAGISSLFTAYSDQALKTAETIKKVSPNTLVVMGGHHPTHFPEQVLESRAVDFIIRGEGEIGLPLLCQSLKEKGDLKHIPGIGFKRKNKMFIASPAWIKDLSGLPLPQFPHFSSKYYKRKHKAAVTVVTSRGCPMPCSYCSVSSKSNHGRFRQRPVSDVLEEIRRQAEEWDIGFIDFEDENLSLNKPYFLSLLNGLDNFFPKEKPELRAMNGLFPPSLDRQVIQAMKNSGFKTLNLSLGSACQNQLKRFNRPDVRRDHDRVLDLAQDHKLSCVSYIIAGGPGQDPVSSVQDLLFLAGKRTLAGLSIFYPAPGSADFALCKDQNLLPTHFSLMRSTALPLDQTTTRVQSITLLRLARILNYMKSRMDSGKGLPVPNFCQGPPKFSPPFDRETVSQALLGYFLATGAIFGVDRDGTLYEHFIDRSLSRIFLDGLTKIPVKGPKN